jgi:hypothetical protein
MNARTHTFRRFVTGLAAGAALACLGASAAQASGPIDDWFRDPGVAARTGAIVVTATSPSRLERAATIFRQHEIAAAAGTSPTVSAVGSPQREVLPQDTPTSGGFDWNDYAVGIGSGIGVALLLAALGALILRMRHGSGQLRSA